MLILRSIGPGVVDYYRKGQDPGFWVGKGSVRLGLSGTIDPDALGQVLAGRHPGTGELIGHAHPHRQGGWGLIFAAPKSVSLLAAVAPLADSHRLVHAHERAVAGTMDWFETEWARVVRDRATVATTGVVAARFEHGGAANGDPHLHTHVLLANLAQGPDGRWSALDRSFWSERYGIGAIYDLALRDEISRAWPGLRWQVDRNGLADVVGVPRAAIEAVSARHHGLRAELDVADASPRRTHLAAVRTRRETPVLEWRTRLAATGFGEDGAAAVLAPSRVLARPPGEGSEAVPTAQAGLADAAEAWLTERAPTWRRSDALQALAATAERGASPASAAAAISGLCRQSPAVAPNRWTTGAARAIDQAVAAAANAPRQRPSAVDERLVAEALAERPHLAPASVEAVRGLVAGEVAAVVLPGAVNRDRFVEQAAVVEAARAIWERAGVRVVVDADPDCAARWDALTGVRPAGHGERAGVIVVDRANYRSGSELLDLLGRASAADAQVVLVGGGTLPVRRHARSEALRHLQAVGVPGDLGLGSPGRSGVRSLQRAESGQVVTCATTADALAAARERWQSYPARERPVLVGLGPPEAEALNHLARRTLLATGEVSDRHVTLWGRDFAAGDRVLARRPGPVPSASLATVTAVHSNPPAVTVRWDGRDATPTTIDRWDAQRFVHGYAVTVGVAARLATPMILLGDPGQVARLAGRDVAGRDLTAVVVAPTSVRRRDPWDRLDRLADLAASRNHQPDRTSERSVASGSVASESVAILATRRDRLEAELRATLPPDVAGVRRRLAEDRAYAAAHPGTAPLQPESLAAHLERGEVALDGWLAANGDRLVEWRELRQQVERHEDLLAHARNLDPHSRANTRDAGLDLGL